MRAVRDVWTELVERRLWPIALLLVAALVAVPFVLAKQPPADEPAADAGAPPVAQAADLRSSGEAIVSVAPEAGGEAPLRGATKNPFKQQHMPKRDSGQVAVFGGSAAVTPGGATGGAGTGGGGQGAPTTTYQYATIDVRFGNAGLSLRQLDDVPRLTPLPSAVEPIVVFLGMRADRQTAVFLVSTDVHAQGDGRCVPSRKTCEAIELRRGDVALLDFAEADGSVTQYELDLVDVTVHETTSKALASGAYARTSRAGARLFGARVRSSRNGVLRRARVPFRYVERRGVLHIAPWASKRARMGRAHGRVSGASLSDLP